MKELPDFTLDLLRHKGALAETITGGARQGLEVLLPQDMATALDLPEHARLCFSPGEEGVYLSYETALFTSMAKLLSDGGAFSSVTLPPTAVRLEKLREKLINRIALNNAVFHPDWTEEKDLSYLLAAFKYRALSDERQEGILFSLINEFNLSLKRLPAWPSDLFDQIVEEPPNGSERQEPEKVIKTLCRAQTKMVEEDLQEFIHSIERRMNRDIRRVEDYYTTLLVETQQFIEKRIPSEEEKEKAAGKVRAIETEWKWKVQDLMAKYALTVQMEPISIIRIETRTPVFWLSIKRRKGIRSFPLTYNPILRAFDSLACEACFYPARIHSVCDDCLHVVCQTCLSPCSRCGRDYCAACYSRGCPRCGPPEKLDEMKR